MEDRGGHLVDRGGGLVGLALLAEHALAYLAHAAGQRLGAFVELGSGRGDGADDALVAGLHGVEGAGHLADFVASLQRYASGQVAALLDVQHHVLEGMQVGEDEADQQLRGRQQRQHQHQHGDGVGAGPVGEDLPQVAGRGEHGEALAGAGLADPGAEQRGIALARAGQGDPHVPVAAGGQGAAGRPALNQLALGGGGALGGSVAPGGFLLHGEQHQQQGGEEGHRVDGPELVFQWNVADPGAHRGISSYRQANGKAPLS
ncbi:Uncharacterised protein [Klebsiella pneumoniae]|nr:Uncharacterised protein [Klebsiella pneumoniae]